MKHNKIFLLSLLAGMCIYQQSTAMTQEQMLRTAERLRRVGQEAAEERARASALRANNFANMQNERARLQALPNPTPVQAGRIAELNARIRQEERTERLEDALDNVGTDMLRGLGTWTTNSLNRDNTIAIETNRIRNEGVINNRGALQRLQYLTEPKTLATIGGAVVVSIITVMAGYYGTKLAYEQIKNSLGVPELVDETSRTSIIRSFLNMFAGKEEKPFRPTEEVILSPAIAEAAEQISEDTRQTHDLHLPYQNLLLYGPPGTGKTAFAKLLAYYTGMDYAILSASRFAQLENEKAITELFNIFKWAESNDRGTILFIDEANAAFRDRKTLDQDGINFVNAFLSKTGSSSDKFMFIFASNYENELDSAVLSRIHKKINFALPALAEREKILQLKIKKYIMDDQRTYIKNDKEVTETLSVASDVTPEYLHEIAQRIEKFSGRDIEYAVLEMRMRAYRSGQNVLTKEIIEKVIKEKIAMVIKDNQAIAHQNAKMAAQFGIPASEATATAA